MAGFFEKRDPWGNGLALWVLVFMAFLTPLAFWSASHIDLENDVRNWLPEDDPQSRMLAWYESVFPTDDRMLVSWEGSSLEDPRAGLLKALLIGQDVSPGAESESQVYFSSVSTPRDAIGRITKSLRKSYFKEYDSEEEAVAALREEVIRRVRGVLVGPGKLRIQLTDAGRAVPDDVRIMLKEQAQEKYGIELQFHDPFDPAETMPEGWTVEDIEDAIVPEDVIEGEVETEDESEEEDPELVELVDQMMQLPARSHDFQASWFGMSPGTDSVDDIRTLATSLRGKPTKQHPEGQVLVEDVFFEPGSPISLLIGLTKAGAKDRDSSLEAIRVAAEKVGIDRDMLRMGGRPVAGHALNKGVEAVGWNENYEGNQFWKRSPFLLSLFVGITLTVFMLRNIRLSVLVIVSAIYVMLLSAALVPATGGSMNMILVVMPTLLMVLTISAAIHVANYWKHGSAHYPDDPTRAVVDAVRMARTPCLLASLTTAIGLGSLTTSTLIPVRDFGIYSALGCILTVLVVLYGLPSMLLFWPSKPVSPDQVDQQGWQNVGRWLYRRRVIVPILCFAVFGVTAAGLLRFQTETKAIRYFPDDSRVVQDYNFLEQNLAGIVPVDLVIWFKPDAKSTKTRDANGDARAMNVLERMEVVRQIEEKMRNHPEISGTIALPDFQPVSEPPKGKSAFATRNYNFRARRVEEELRDPETGAGGFYQIGKEDSDLSGKGDEIWRITAQVAIMSELDYGTLTEDLDAIAKSVLRDYPGSDHVVTGMVPVFLRTQQALLESLIKSFAIAFAIIAVVMMFLLRSPLAGLITMLPNLLPVGVVFGLISWAGLRVDIGTMITASVALGIAVDGTLHLLAWFRKGLRDGLNREDALALALGHCGPAMWQTSATVGLGLLMLSFADILLVSRFGWLMASLIGTALIADIIFLPALLAGPLGTLIKNALPEGASLLDVDDDLDEEQSSTETGAVPIQDAS